ncbi:DNA mismatch repair protein MutS [Mesosutterella porci]|nr:DNA mismatch repair protein MutS [Mesosutterella sp. oilRF-744-WT-GAM-9]
MNASKPILTTENADPASLTPAMQQFLEIRRGLVKQYPNIILLYRMGDFYETFFEDAVEINRLLGITLTSRGKTVPVPLAGVPYMTLDSYLARLVKAGKAVGIVEQQGDSTTNKGAVPRKLVRIVTPGTLTESELLPSKADAALLALEPPLGKKAPEWSIVSLVLSNGAFKAMSVAEEELAGEIARIAPKEILVPDSIREKAQGFASGALVTPLPDWHFDPEHGAEQLRHHFQMESLDAWAVSEKPGILAAAGAVLGYVSQTQIESMPHIRPLVLEESSRFVGLDAATRRNLELTESLRSGGGPTLLSTIDHCLTAMGSRMLRGWITQPMRAPEVPRERHRAVGELVGDPDKCEELASALRPLPDLERIASRIALGSVRPRELAGLRDALPQLSKLSKAAAGCLSDCFKAAAPVLDPPQELSETLTRALLPEPAVTLRDGEVIADSFSDELRQLRSLRDHAGDFLTELEAREKQRTGIPNLRVEYNRVTGYFIEVTRGQADRVPADYRRRQTLKNVERFVTPELKGWEDKAIAARERSVQLERELYEGLVRSCSAWVERLTEASEAAASIDALLSLARHARDMEWTEPELSEQSGIVIRGARHPVVEKAIEHYVANDCELVPGRRLLVITGPNMGGKSTYMRSVALIALLALAGSWVPAQSARIGPIDRILTRIGASDDLAGGKSTFMVEMVEAAAILHQASSRSLVLMDEIGRGTSTFDGLSLAAAIARELADRIRSYTLFATHFFELTQLSQSCAEVANVHVRAIQSSGRVVFLHEVREGPASQSYGIAVAQLAGVPQRVIREARSTLRELEERSRLSGEQPDLFSSPGAGAQDEAPAEEEEDTEAQAALRLRDEIAALDPDSLTPRDALVRLYTLIEQARGGKPA